MHSAIVGAKFGLTRIFHQARWARRERCAEIETIRDLFPYRLQLVWDPDLPTQSVGSKFLRCAPEFASASMHLLAQILHYSA